MVVTRLGCHGAHCAQLSPSSQQQKARDDEEMIQTYEGCVGMFGDGEVRRIRGGRNSVKCVGVWLRDAVCHVVTWYSLTIHGEQRRIRNIAVGRISRPAPAHSENGMYLR